MLSDRAADQRIQLSGEPRAVERRGILFLHSLDRTALNEEPLYRIERRQLVMTRLQCPHIGRDAEQPAKEILDMRRQIDNEVRFGRMLEPVRIAPRRHQPLMQPGIDFRRDGQRTPDRPARDRRDHRDRRNRGHARERDRSYRLVKGGSIRKPAGKLLRLGCVVFEAAPQMERASPDERAINWLQHCGGVSPPTILPSRSAGSPSPR